MKVVILCGGQGTRLREHTEHLPKPLVPIGNRPIVWHIMRAFAHQGFDEFVLCLGYKGTRIKEYFANAQLQDHDVTLELRTGRRVIHTRSETLDWKVTLVDTGDAAMTGARIARAAKYIDGERFIVTYGDGVSDIDVRQLVAFHEGHGRKGTVTGVHPPARFGELMLTGDAVNSFSEKPQVTDSWINGGFFVFERAFLDYLSMNDGCILEREPLERLAQQRQLMAYRHAGFWQCMDTYRDWKMLNDVWDRGEAPWQVWKERAQLLQYAG
ncbi:MAG: glucose-1-phosphate cytidylyltransferase [Kiritimatiellia bacterium]|jgi:glucose-1-phosphate cytidylyltransferase